MLHIFALIPFTFWTSIPKEKARVNKKSWTHQTSHLFPLVLLSLVFQKFEPGFDEGVVVSTVILQHLVLQVNDVRTHSVHKILQATTNILVRRE